MAEQGNSAKQRGYRRGAVRQAASEREHLLSFLQAASQGLHNGAYTLDPTSRTIIVHPGTFRQAQDESLATYLRLLLDSTGEGIYGLDLEGCCTFSNRAGAAMLGYQPDDLLGRNMHQLIHHSYGDGSAYPEPACPIFRAFQDGQGIRVDTEVLWRCDGTTFPAEYSSYPIIESGEIVGAAVTFRDITKRK